MKATKEIIQPHSQEWYLARLSKFSSSEIHKLIGEGRKKDAVFGDTGMSYIYEKVSETISGELPEQRSSASLDWGIANEGNAIIEFERAYRETVQTGTFYDLDKMYCGTPDGETANRILEVKCPYNGGNHIENLLIRDTKTLKEKRKEYYWQVQGNMYLAEKTSAYFISFDPRLPAPINLHVVEILLIEEDAEAMIEKVRMANELKDRMLINLAESYVNNPIYANGN